MGVYDKIRVRIHTLDGDQLAWLYVLNAYEGGLPSARYLGIMADAAELAGAPDDYVRDVADPPMPEYRPVTRDAPRHCPGQSRQGSGSTFCPFRPIGTPWV